MRNIFLEQQGGAIVSTPADADTWVKSQLAAAGKPTLAAPYVNLKEVLSAAHQARAEEAGRLLRAFFGWLRQGVKHVTRSDLERYLAQSSDLADLERRLEALTRGERPLAYY